MNTFMSVIVAEPDAKLILSDKTQFHGWIFECPYFVTDSFDSKRKRKESVET